MGVLTFRHDPEDKHLDLSMREKGLHQAVEDLVGLLPIHSLSSKSGETVVITSQDGGGTGPGKTQIGSYKSRMWRRRRKDDDDDERRRRRGKRDPDDYDLLFGLRRKAMVAYAIDVTTGQVYVGYSGGASAVYSQKLSFHSRRHRVQRVHPYLGGVKKQTDFDPLNCAEVAALNVAISHGAQIGNLFFISMDSDGNLRNPCPNCIQWITQYARGYLHV